MKLVPLNTIFSFENGNDMELNKLKKTSKGINFVSRTKKNNGVSAVYEQVEGINPNPSGSITVSLGGSVLESFIQDSEFYTSYHIRVLKPIVEMTEIQKLFYCMCIRNNKFRYNFGRQANKTLETILVPSLESIPSWVNEVRLIDLSHIKDKFDDTNTPEIDTDTWKDFKLYPDIFDMVAGKYYPSTSFNQGTIPLISSTDSNNGVSKFTNLEPAYNGNCITIGKVVCSAYYQKDPFCATADATVLIPKININEFSGLFIASVISMETFRWNYGRQIRLNNCKDLIIKLPAKKYNGKYIPDTDYMESYIKTLNFSKNI